MARNPNRSDYHREEDEEMHASPPLDLSFKNARTINDLLNRAVQSTRVGKLPDLSVNERYLTSSLWLSNNVFSSCAGLDNLAKHFLEDPTELRWLDLAYNRIGDLDDELLKFKNLTILYLHGNLLSDMKSIVKLRSLTNLRNLTLHGNPIEQMPAYRRYIVAILPWITNLDFSPVIDTEKKRALPTGFHKTVQVDL
ncbi:leucine-rich repeat-containing protein 51-like [Phymastichus coffea]|uniref:leucine-rich repeat-containing protein 51-like n=1 Tax=Phymastichus coffea TaxID=108790 RepID=UPI00273B4D59|nr:leucine-rich repeat-containing protein 51-like [Phymastichus coffea]